MFYISKSTGHLAIELNRNSKLVIIYDADEVTVLSVSRRELRHDYLAIGSLEHLPYWIQIKQGFTIRKAETGGN